MGGKLFELGRVEKEKYIEIEKELIEYMNNKFPSDKVTFRIPRYYQSKPDFGDVDILLSHSAIENWNILRKEIIKDLNVSNFKLGKELSMAYKDMIQVDIMPTPEGQLDATWQFLCYNDLGNLLGKHYRRFNLKYGEKGLFYVFRRSDDSSYKKDILLTTDMRKILGFLELSFEEWDAGFKTLESMFDWVIACKYFTCSPFINLTKNTSKRAKLRTTMRKFVQYVEDNNITKDYGFDSDKHVYFPKIIEYFSDIPLVDIIEKEKQLELIEEDVKSKFSGNIIMGKYPTLQGPSLGKFISQYKNQFSDFTNDIHNMSKEQVIESIDSFYKQFQQITFVI